MSGRNTEFLVKWSNLLWPETVFTQNNWEDDGKGIEILSYDEVIEALMNRYHGEADQIVNAIIADMSHAGFDGGSRALVADGVFGTVAEH